MSKGVLLVSLVLLLSISSILAWTAQEFVDAHNLVRDNPGATPVTPLSHLTWSTQLATTAQNYANGCPATPCQGHNLNRSVGYEPNYIGENIYWTLGTNNSIASNSVVAWDSERQYYNFQTGACSGVCGHFTQLIWDDTTQVGCGVTVCPYPSSCPDFFGGNPFQQYYNTFTVVVCNYLIGGNWIGQLPYDVGVPTVSPTISVSPSKSISNSAAVSPTASISISNIASVSPVASPTPSISVTSAASSSPAASVSSSVSRTPSISVTSAASSSPSISVSAAASSSPSVTPTLGVSATSSQSLSGSNSPSPTISISAAASVSSTSSISLSGSNTPTSSISSSIAASLSPTRSISLSGSNTPSSSISISAAASVSPSKSSACPVCDPNAICQSGSCVCNSGYSGNGQTCTVIGQTVPNFLLDWSLVRGSSNFYIPTTTMNLPAAVTTPQWLRWTHADPVFVGSTQYTFGANILAATGDIALGLRYSQSGSSRAKDAAVWIGRINSATSEISFYFCFAYYAPNSYSCSFGTPYGTRSWNTTGYNSFSVQITDSGGYLYLSPKLNGANAINYSALYIDRNYYPSTGGAVLIANNTNYVEWNTVFIQTESTILMTLTSCMSSTDVKNLVATTLGIPVSQITATASSVDSSSCASTKRSIENVEEATAGSFVVTLSGDASMVAQAMSSKLTALANQGALPGVSSVASTAPANLAEITSAAFAGAAPTAGVVAPVAGGLAAAGGAGGAAGLSGGAIVGITLGSVTAALLAVGVAAVVVAAIIVAASKRREQKDADEYPSSTPSRRPQSEIEIAALEAAAIEEEEQGQTFVFFYY